jgi:RNA ligase (TIGR02306 family)
VKLSKSRVKTIKLRGAISQGMFISLLETDMYRWFRDAEHGDDLTDAMGITHYEPPAPCPSMRGEMLPKKHRNPNFPTYTKISHFKNQPALFAEGEEVIVTEKIHGTNFRAGWVKTVADSWWRKALRAVGLYPEWEFVYGSHNVQLNGKRGWNGFYGHNVYREAVDKHMLEQTIPKGYVVYGEIFGDGIQKGYHYGLKGERQLRIFDVLTTKDDGTQEYMSWASVNYMSLLIGVLPAPVVYQGPFNAERVKEWEQGPSLVGPQDHREGVVIKPTYEQQTWIGRKMLRSINPEYLLINESDWH